MHFPILLKFGRMVQCGSTEVGKVHFRSNLRWPMPSKLEMV